MEPMEIVLLVVGAVLFIVSFLIPNNREKDSGLSREMAKAEIRKMVSDEMSEIRIHVNDVVDEAVEYAMEKTQRSLERISNEKIMAVNEYSDTVMKDIHKNHEEVVFLYDMLNDKHKSLKNIVSEATKTAKDIEEAKKEIEKLELAKKDSIKASGKEATNNENSKNFAAEESTQKDVNTDGQGREVKSFSDFSSMFEHVMVQDLIDQEDVVINPIEGIVEFPAFAKQESTEAPSESEDDDANNHNKNAQIMELYQQGKSNVAIAKELGLGVGEVKLVIDLYKNA